MRDAPATTGAREFNRPRCQGSSCEVRGHGRDPNPIPDLDSSPFRDRGDHPSPGACGQGLPNVRAHRNGRSLQS